MYPYNKQYVFILSVKETLLTIIRTSYPTLPYLIPIYRKLYRYLIIYFTTVRCFKLKLTRNCKRIKAKKVTFNRIIITVYRIDLISF